jgi:hypothetical protein
LPIAQCNNKQPTPGSLWGAEDEECGLLRKLVQAPNLDAALVYSIVVQSNTYARCARPTVMEVRVLVSAADAGKAWDLRCELREKLIDFLQRNYPQCLPRMRAEVVSNNDGGTGATGLPFSG